MRTQLPLAVLKLKLIQTPNNFNRLLSIRSQMWFSCLISVRCHSSPNVKHSVKLHWLGSSSLLSTVGLLACSSNPHSEIGSVAYYHQTYEQPFWSLDSLTPYILSVHGLFVSLILREPIGAMCGYLVVIMPYLSQEGCVLTTLLPS